MNLRVAAGAAVVASWLGVTAAQQITRIECAVTDPSVELMALGFDQIIAMLKLERYRFTYVMSSESVITASVDTTRGSGQLAYLAPGPEMLMFNFENKRIFLDRRTGRFELRMGNFDRALAYGLCERIGERQF